MSLIPAMSFMRVLKSFGDSCIILESSPCLIIEAICILSKFMPTADSISRVVDSPICLRSPAAMFSHASPEASSRMGVATPPFIFLVALRVRPLDSKVTLANPEGAPWRTIDLFTLRVCLPKSANVIASTMLDLPAPLGPTMTFMPGPKATLVSLCDKKSTSSTSVIILRAPS